MARRTSASSECHSVSSDAAPSASPCQVKKRDFGCAARTPAISHGSPAAAATMPRVRRRVTLRMGGRLAVALQPPRRDQRRAALIVEIFDLTVDALEGL